MMGRVTFHAGKDKGQATVEAAFLTPVLFVVLLLLLQPGIILYDRSVMEAAASETCRLLATTPSHSVSSCESFVRNRLGSIPAVSLFHVHEGRCSWVIELEGDESSSEVRVKLETAIRPLPLLGAGASLLGMLDGSGNMRVSVERSQSVQPHWATDVAGGSPADDWVGAWYA